MKMEMFYYRANCDHVFPMMAIRKDTSRVNLKKKLSIELTQNSTRISYDNGLSSVQHNVIIQTETGLSFVGSFGPYEQLNL